MKGTKNKRTPETNAPFLLRPPSPQPRPELIVGSCCPSSLRTGLDSRRHKRTGSSPEVPLAAPVAPYSSSCGYSARSVESGAGERLLFSRRRGRCRGCGPHCCRPSSSSGRQCRRPCGSLGCPSAWFVLVHGLVGNVVDMSSTRRDGAPYVVLIPTTRDFPRHGRSCRG